MVTRSEAVEFWRKWRWYERNAFPWRRAAIYRELLTRLPDIEVAGEPSYTVSTFFHGVNHLPVRFTPER